jgi:hypothetical protein
LPSGWTVTSIDPTTTVTLSPGQTQQVFVTIRGPASGSADVQIEAIDTTNPFGATVTIPAQVQVATATPTNPTFSWNPTATSITVTPGGTAVQANLTLQSNSSVSQTYNITTNIADFAGWGIIVAPSNSTTLTGNTSQQFAFFINAPAGTASGTYPIQVRATRQSDGSPILGVINVTVASATATPTQSPTATPTSGPVCPEGSRDPGNDMGSARQILVDLANNHGICTPGDEDWFKFAAIGNKVYTLDITRFEPGLDLVIELYDDQGNRLAFNDDFFARTPPPASTGLTPAPTRDIAPRIQSWRAPKDGIYYVRVRDSAGIGGSNKTYTFVVFSESYGPTPPTVTEICRDLFEEDGLPEEATLITSNEVQAGHRLCPSGDADWVKFFGKAGKTYYIYTDTRPYRNNPSANPSNTETQAGADTIMFLADRDGTSIIDLNDDIETADASSLDSQIRFVPRVDGFYFVQIKNTGDIGNQFIRYDLVLTQCAPGRDDCGRARTAVNVVPTSQPAPTQVVATPANLDRTPTPTLSPTVTTTPPTFLEQSRPIELVNGPLIGFANRAFELVWRRSDAPVASGLTKRSWVWGPKTLMARSEGYLQTDGGLRQVQYFYKGRMEITYPEADPTSAGYVTNGLLALELVTGRMQVGDTDFVQRGPADLPIAGDVDAAGAPTYGSFAAVVGGRSDDRTGVLPGEQLDRAGTIGQFSGSVSSETQFARFVDETGHNIPGVFWNYLTVRGPVENDGQIREGEPVDWHAIVGYPVSEPFWVRTRVGGAERDVLVQVFERRVLTYDPANAAGWRVEMGNVGRHYYHWRYGEELPPSSP